MPQLEPSPWLMFLLFTWSVLMTFIPTKMISRMYSNKIVPETKQKTTKNSWPWPWW